MGLSWRIRVSLNDIYTHPIITDVNQQIWTLIIPVREFWQACLILSKFKYIKQVFVHDLGVNVRLQFSKKEYEIILFESNYKAIGCSLLISSWLKNFSVLHNAHCGFSAKEIDFRVEFERRQQRIIISCLVVEHLRSHSTTFKKRRRFKAERSGSSYKNNPTPPHIQPQKTSNLEQKKGFEK